MSRFRPALICFALTASPATAADCPGFGLSSEYLSRVFCGQFSDVAGPTTRTTRGGATGDLTATDEVPPGWLDLPIVAEAWRSDPAKTLALIKRIRDAGGRPQR